MGIDYVYANHSKRQYFDVGLFGKSCRFTNAGFSFGSRVLSLLISERGSWNSDSIEMLDNVSDKGLSLAAEYTNISVEAELLMLDVDGVEIFKEEAELDFVTFSNLCLYAMLLSRPDVVELLNDKYGRGGWQKKYKAYYTTPTGLEQAIYEAQGRDLVLYRK